MSNIKNLLQEQCAATKKSRPIYQTRQTGGTSHEPIYQSICIVDEKSFVGNPAQKKKLAEFNAAQIAYTKIFTTSFFGEETKESKEVKEVSTKIKSEVKSALSEKCIVLVDIDNVDLSKSTVEKYPSTYFYIFVSRNGTKSVDHLRNLKNCIIKRPAMVGRDVSDICMIWETRELFETEPPTTKFAIMTRDHFGSVLSTLAHAAFICSEEELQKWLLHPITPSGDYEIYV